ncbi:hypothetical protein SAY87_023079 [Trapa incisa]|uniref:Nuclear pore complex protein n=1 Tax=Trapa incisa TaxID=236973 RepID=A0AAN7Q5U4_9MYRT|nr:hypothetical protein SAY87_023079 [Trapa incisa]
MATSREESDPHGVSGAVGKFRKKPYRRVPSTPYDRPPTAIRNPSIAPGDVSNSWLRKVVDPAHKLLAATARGFYTSVFRKHLTHSPPTPQPLEAKEEAVEKHEAPVSLNISKEQEAVSDGNPSFGLGGGSSKDLEEVLKLRTFTRSEIDRLVVLLHDSAVDNSVMVEEKGPSVQPSNAGLSCGQREEALNIPLQKDRNGIHLMSSKEVNSSVFDEVAASPAELAKAYMTSRPSKLSSSMLRLHSQALSEDSTVPSSLGHPSKSPILSLVPSSSGHVGACENSYATPRSRGRSSVYSMAKTPYTRVHLTNALKSSEPIVDGYDLPSSSTQAPEHYRSSGSTKALKRSSSIFENAMNSGGPLRRTRLKPNLSYRRSWIVPISETGGPSSSTHKIHSVSGRKSSFTEQSNVVPASTKSREVASKILEQLDKIVSQPKERSFELKLADVREKAPAQLTPSKLNAPSSTFAISDKLSPSISGLGSRITMGKSNDHPTDSPARVQKECSRAHEVFFDLEGDGYANGISSSLFKGIEKQEDGIVEVMSSDVQANVIPEKHETVTEDQPCSNVFREETTSCGAEGNQVPVQTHTNVSFSTVPVTSMSFQSNILVTQSSSSPDKVLTFKEPDDNNSEFTTNNADKSPQLKFDVSSSADLFNVKRNRVETPSRGQDNAEDRKHPRAGAFSAMPDDSIVAFESTASTTSSNAHSVSIPISEDLTIMASQKPFSITTFPDAFGNSSLFSTINDTTTSPALPIFGSGSSQLNSLFQAQSPTAVASEVAKAEPDMTSWNLAAGSFVAAKSSLQSSTFGFVPTSVPSNGNNQNEISAIASAVNESVQAVESTAAGIGFTNLTESVSIDVPSAIKNFSSVSSCLSPSSPSLFSQATTTPAFVSSLTSKSPSMAFPFGSSISSSSDFVFGSGPSFPRADTSSGSTATPISTVSSAYNGAAVFGPLGASLDSHGTSSSPIFGSMGFSSDSTLSLPASSAGPSSGPAISFALAAASPSPSPVFGGSNPTFAFGSPASIVNNSTDLMSKVDWVPDDTFQAYNSGSITPVFGQQPVPQIAGSIFCSNAAAGSSPFQFGAQQKLPTPENQSLFQASGSLDFSAGGGGFSLGSGGNDKSRRKIVRINRNKQHKRK